MPRRRLRSASRKVPFASLVPWHCSQPGPASQPCVPPTPGGMGQAGPGLPTTSWGCPSPPARGTQGP